MRPDAGESRLQNPISDGYGEETTEAALVRSALDGRREALEDLVRRHEPWVFNIALRMLWNRSDAEDATQEILVKIVTGLSSYRRESAFRTWAHRIAVNHLLSCRRSRAECAVKNFECYGRALDATPDDEWPDESGASPDSSLLAEEVKIGCMTGMLLCLDREQRLVFVLGEIFEVTDALGAEILDISRENFRQKLSRARSQLYGFMKGKCGLANPANPCRCKRKTLGFIRAGIVDPERLQFTGPHLANVAETAPGKAKEMQQVSEEACARLFRDHPLQDVRGMAASLRAIVEGARLRAVLDVDGTDSKT
jgi:RNA polymerase sigma factor (sigma-70 family)